MNYKFLFYLIGIVMLILAGLLLLPILVSAIYGESVLPFLYTVLITLAVSLSLILLTRTNNKRIYAKEGFVCVALSWILMSALGALPFVFSGAMPNYIDAFFETVSGLTTTGATLLSEVESLPRGVLFWRSFTHWIGGMGVIVFMLAIMPSEGGAVIHVMRAEVPGPTKGKLVPKVKQTSLILYGIYFGITLVETIALLIAGLPLFDAVVNSFSTTGTGGFSVLNDSIAGYNNPAAEWIIAIFMLISGVNFSIYFYIIVKNFSPVLKNEELKAYLFICFVSTALIAVNVWQGMGESYVFESVGDCIRSAFFHVASIMSTTGFVTTDFNLWPEFSKALLLILMLIGACAGSTAGGFKISRLLIVFKMMKAQIKKMLKPNSVKPLRIDGETVNESVGRSAVNYLAFYIVSMVIVMLLISADNFDLVTNITATVTCFNNVGPGLGKIVGPIYNFVPFSPFSKLVLSFAMLFGRLEIIPMIILISPSTWKKK